MLCPDLDSCVSVTNILAPEHLEVLTQNANDLANRFENFGGMFIGERAAEVVSQRRSFLCGVVPTNALLYSLGIMVQGQITFSQQVERQNTLAACLCTLLYEFELGCALMTHKNQRH